MPLTEYALFMMRLWADEIKMQLDIWDKLTIAEEFLMTEEDET